MRKVGSKKQKNKLPRRKTLVEFCLGCKNASVGMFENPCNECNREFHSQHLKPKTPLNFVKGGELKTYWRNPNLD